MFNTTPFLPGISHRLVGRQHRCQLDRLRVQTEQLRQASVMVRKEIAMHAIAYNLIRALMQDIARTYQMDVSRLSFKGTVDALRQWRELFEAAKAQPRLRAPLGVARASCKTPKG